MPVTAESQKTRSLLRVTGDLDLNSATELRGLLLQCLSSGKDIFLDLEGAGEIDISILQLLWVAGREAAGAGTPISGRLSQTAATAAREAGFDTLPATLQD